MITDTGIMKMVVGREYNEKAEIIEKLHQYPPDMRVEITDGYKLYFYRGDFAFQLFECDDGETFVDIGIGGFDYD